VAGLTDIAALDAELAEFVGSPRLLTVASLGLRGEVFYPTPLLLRANPQLLGYYRLLYGFSQKEFYDRAGANFRGFKPMEERGVVPRGYGDRLPALCRSLIETGALLLDGIGPVTQQDVHDLQLLTIGPQFRGSRNTDLGKEAVGLVFNLIKGFIRDDYLRTVTDTEIGIENASGRTVRIRFAADPDIAITEIVGQNELRRVAIEVKGGTDASNRLNRLGEAEKSHLKARAAGFRDFWTIAAVAATRQDVTDSSPTTTSFFLLQDIGTLGLAERHAFREQLASVLGIAINESVP